MKFRLLYIISLCFLITAGLTGCLEYQVPARIPTPTPSPTPTPEPVTNTAPSPAEGGTLRLSMREPLTLNPLLNEDVTADRLLKLVFEPVLTLDETMKPVANIASINFASDYASATLTFRDDAIWSDGTPVTSGDFLFSVETLRNAPEGGIYKHNIDHFGLCEEIDEKTVKITFTEAFGGSAYYFVFPVIPRHYYENETDPASEKNKTPLGNGLFIYSGSLPRESIILAQSPYSIHPRAYIETVEVKFLPNTSTELHAFDQELIDAISIKVTDWSRHHSVKPTRSGEYTAQQYEFIGFNFQREILQDKRLREAVAYGFDKDTHIAGLYLAHAERALTPVNPQSWLYNEEAPAYAYDMNHAATLIDQIWQTVPDLFAYPFNIITNMENDERVRTAGALAQSMKALGLNATVETLPMDELTARLREGNYDLFVGGYNLSLIPDLRFAFSENNLLFYQNADLDQLLALAASAATEAEYAGILYDMQSFIAEELPVISLAFLKSAVLTDTKIQGDIRPSIINIFANINEWYIVE